MEHTTCALKQIIDIEWGQWAHSPNLSQHPLEHSTEDML